jgi:outer membrane protein OmpA-like peptidoglycan-associated protein
MIEEESSVTKSTPPVQEPVTQTTVAEVATPATAPVETVEEEEEPSEPLKIIPVSEMTLGNTEAFLSLYNEANDRVVKGKVQVVDTERGRLMTEIEGNSYLNISDPKSKSGRLSLICRAFGYRTVQQEITFVKPLNDSTATFIEDMGTALIIKFPLVRYQKGDIEVLYNVYFYNDAAIFLPESRFELNELLRMMQENEKYRIRLHGHANGNYHGKIIEVGPSKNFFAVTDDAVNKIGSAKELSESRAQVIKDYLVANGIAEDRMEVKAWGGKKPLYDKKGANAKKNIRVEVEVLSE